MVISGLGMGVTTLLFAATFWANSHPNETVIGNSTVKMVLTNHVFLVTTLALYIAFFNLGFGPIRYTLQSELFTPKEQVRKMTMLGLITLFLENCWFYLPNGLVGVWVLGHKDVPRPEPRLWIHRHLPGHREPLLPWCCLHNPVCA